MTPGKISNKNATFVSPPNWDGEKLGVCQDIDAFKFPQGVITHWYPTREEMIELTKGCPVVLCIFGQGMPPVSLGVQGRDGELVPHKDARKGSDIIDDLIKDAKDGGPSRTD